MKLTRDSWMRMGMRLTQCVVLAGLLMEAAAMRGQGVGTTTVQGTVYLANGQPASGTLTVSWPAFTTASGQLVAADKTNVTIPADGFVSINLAPNQGAMPAGEYYTAVFYLSDGTVTTQYWVVPQAAQATLAQVQAQIMPASQAVQAVNKAYVDQAVTEASGNQLAVAGGTLTGPLFLAGDPTQATQAADKHYVDSSFAQAVPTTGGAVTGALTAKQLGGAYEVDQFTGADFGAKLQACLAGLNSTYGGTCDARNFTGTLAMSANVTMATGNTTIELPCATIATSSQLVVTAGTRNVAIRGCALRGGSAANGNQGGTVLEYSGAAAALEVGDPTYAQDTMGFHMDNVAISTTGATSAAAEGLVAYRTQELDLESLYFLGNSNQTAMTLDGTGNYTGGTFYDNAFNGFKTAVNAIGHQVTNPATTDWLNASAFVRLHIDCPTSNGSPIAGTVGINLAQGDGNTFTGGDVEGCSTALHLGANAQNNTIVGLRNENSTDQVVADAGSSYNNWMTGGTMFTGALVDNGTRNSFLDTFHRSFNGLNGDWYGSQQDATVTNHYRLGIGTGNERGLLNEIQTDYGYRWIDGYTDATAGEQYYQVQDLLNNVNRLSIGQYNHGQSSTNNQTVLNAAGTGAVVLNGSNNAGTGGVVFGSGGPSETTVATIDSAGDAQLNGTLQVNGASTFVNTPTVKNQADAEIDATLWAGATTSQKESYIYKDWNGASQWYMVKDASNNWALNSAVGGLDSFKAYQSTNSGDTYINASNATGAVRINYETGAGTAFNIYGGGSGNLYASFTGTNAIKFPGLAAGTGHDCLQIDNSGYITNTGSACSTGVGTVNSGNSGQIAYYSANGTTLAGMSTIPVGSGGTGAATAAGALSSLGGVSKSGDTMTGALTAPQFNGPVNGNVTGNLTGNASTATALAAAPGQCTAGQFATGVTANGTSNCTAVSYTQLAGAAPTWNQSTTGTAAGFTGSLSGDVTGTQAATVVAKVNGASVPASAALTGTNGSGQITAVSTLPTTAEPAHTGDVTNTAGALAMTVRGINGVSLSGLTSGLLKNATGTGAPSIAVPGTDYVTPGGSITGTAGNVTGTVATTNGGTGATTAAQALANLGAAALSGASFSGAVTAPTIEGALYADREQTPANTGNNGIANSLAQCSSLGQTACSIIVPPTYSQAEAQPWGSGNVMNTGYTHEYGPKSTDPLGCVTDWRWGAPQVLCNQGLANGTSGRFLGSSPIFAQNVTMVGQGFSPWSPQALTVQYTSFAGSRDYQNEETYLAAETNTAVVNTSGSAYNFLANMYHYGLGDSIPIFTTSYSAGQGLAQNEGMEWRTRWEETGNVLDAALTGMTCGTSYPSCTFSMTQTNGLTGSYGTDLALIDLTNAYNAGYISRITAGTFTGSGTNWDSTYGDTTGTATTTAAVNNTSGGNPNQNTFPQSNVTIPLNNVQTLSGSAAFSVGQIVCMFDSVDPSWQCAHITGVSITGGSGTITVDRMNWPLSSGSTVSAGGLAGYGFGMDADWVTPGNYNGYGGSDFAPNGTIRQVYPIVSNASGNTLTIYTPAGVNGNISTRAYGQMGSGGSGAVTVVSGAVTGCTVSGGTGYFGATEPPQLTVTGITYTTAPVIYVSAISGGALSGCSVAAGGSGITGTPTVVVTPSNSYHIYPQARTYSVYNATTGAVDGSDIVTTPAVGTFASGDSVEQPHYFRMKIEGLNAASTIWQEDGQHSNLTFETSGSFGSNDYEATFNNANDPTVYQNYPAAPEPYMVGRGQLSTPYGISLGGPHRNGLMMLLPPYGGNGGSRTGAVVVRCGSALQCAAWNTTVPVLNLNNATGANNVGEDVLGYNPATQTWTVTSGATGYAGASPSCTYTFGPNGMSSSGPGCASSSGSSMNAGAPAPLQFLGTGADGANTNASGAIYGVKYYTNFTVPSGNTVTVNASGGPGGLIVHASGACVINGTILANGSQNTTSEHGVAGGTGGGGGGGTAAGTAGLGSYPSQAQTGYGGWPSGAGGAASGGVGGAGNSFSGNELRAFVDTLPLDGIYGQGGGGGQGGSSGGAGGNGGAIVVLICQSISGTGTIDVSGAAGTNAAANNTGAGGGGGGGLIILSSQASETFSGLTLNTAGGAGGTCGSYTGCGAGGAGGSGSLTEYQNW